MKSVGFIYHPDFLKHDTGFGHPESPKRLEAIVRHLKKNGHWDQLHHIEPRAASLDWVTTVHSVGHVRMVERRCLSGEPVLDDGDTHVCPDSFRIALTAVGGALKGVDEVMEGSSRRTFCAARPPGHHAEASKVMGFCLFNNVAAAARYAQKNYGVERVAIVDWDVHHGNGTQEIFYSDPSVLYISLHQYPLWPGTGAAHETGTDEGEGFTLNCPMKPGSGETAYLEAFRESVIPKINKFEPQILILSAGFDAHKADPLANISLTERSFELMTTMIREVAERHCAGRIVSVLEGGYDLDALAGSVEAHLSALSS